MYNDIIEYIKKMGYSSTEDLKNLKDTPQRCKKALKNYIWNTKKIKKNLKAYVKIGFPMPGDPGIMLTDCVTISICPHHLLPVVNQMYIGYMPIDNTKVIGLSKLVRIATVLSKRPVLQELLAIDIASALYDGKYSSKDSNYKNGFPYFESLGSFCIMGSMHSCMFTRGVESFSLAREAKFRGIFLENMDIKQEVYSLIKTYPATSFLFK